MWHSLLLFSSKSFSNKNSINPFLHSIQQWLLNQSGSIHIFFYNLSQVQLNLNQILPLQIGKHLGFCSTSKSDQIFFLILSYLMLRVFQGEFILHSKFFHTVCCIGYNLQVMLYHQLRNSFLIFGSPTSSLLTASNASCPNLLLGPQQLMHLVLQTAL